MKYPIFSIRDNKANFGLPWCDLSENTARRGFAFQINNPDGIMNFAPKDYDLYKIGVFDNESGLVVNLDIPEFVVAGTAVFNEK